MSLRKACLLSGQAINKLSNDKLFIISIRMALAMKKVKRVQSYAKVVGTEK